MSREAIRRAWEQYFWKMPVCCQDQAGENTPLLLTRAPTLAEKADAVLASLPSTQGETGNPKKEANPKKPSAESSELPKTSPEKIASKIADPELRAIFTRSDFSTKTDLYPHLIESIPKVSQTLKEYEEFAQTAEIKEDLFEKFGIENFVAGDIFAVFLEGYTGSASTTRHVFGTTRKLTEFCKAKLGIAAEIAFFLNTILHDVGKMRVKYATSEIDQKAGRRVSPEERDHSAKAIYENQNTENIPQDAFDALIRTHDVGGTNFLAQKGIHPALTLGAKYHHKSVPEIEDLQKNGELTSEQAEMIKYIIIFDSLDAMEHRQGNSNPKRTENLSRERRAGELIACYEQFDLRCLSEYINFLTNKKPEHLAGQVVCVFKNVSDLEKSILTIKIIERVRTLGKMAWNLSAEAVEKTLEEIVKAFQEASSSFELVMTCNPKGLPVVQTNNLIEETEKLGSQLRLDRGIIKEIINVQK